jgi:hypothetical protein
MSSLKDLASLIMIPSLVKDGRLDTVKPLGNSIIHPDATGNNDGTDGSTPAEGNFTFSRGSNLAATRVDVNGLIEKGRENLLLQSNQFDTTWSTPSSSVTGGQSGYDGSNDAWQLTATNTSNAYVHQSLSFNSVQTLSVYAKANTADFVELVTIGGGGANPRSWFNLATGSVGTSYNCIDTKIEAVSGGWYRCSITLNASITSYRVYVMDGDNSTAVTNGNSIYIQDSQLESSLVATSVISTGASTAQSGILEDLPRLDYSGGASCPSLLLEPQRTNIFDYSEYFSGSYWAKTGTGGGNAPIVTQNYAVSPEGLNNASRVQFDTNGSSSANRSGLVRDFAFTTGDKYAISCWVKSASGSDEIFTFRIAGAQVGGEKIATSEWQLFTETHTATATTTDNFGMQIRGNYSSQTSDILIYGMQLESGVSYPTSYIPTYGSAVTRSLDSCVKTGISSLLNDNEGTLFLEMKGISDGGDSRRFTISNGSIDNRVSLEYDESAGRIKAFMSTGGTTTGALDESGHPQNENHKIALTYNSSAFKIFIDGVLQGTDSNLTGTPIGLDEIEFKSGSGNNPMEGLVKQALVFKTALTDSEAIALTTL